MAFVTANRRPLSRYVPRQTSRGEAPLPPLWVRPTRPIERPALAQFVFLSMLLHALAIALFGAPSGGSREGRAMWGSLQVILQGPYREAAPTLKLDREVKPVAPVQPQRRSSSAREESRRPSFPPLLDRISPPDLKLDRLPTLRVPLPTSPRVVPGQAPEPAAPEAPAAERLAPPVVERLPAEPSPIPAPLLQPLPSAPLPEHRPLPPVEQLIEAPALPALPSTPLVERRPVEVQPLPVPPIESVAPRVSEPATKPAESTPTPEVLAPPKLPTALERALTPPAPAPSATPSAQERPMVREPPLRGPAAPGAGPAESVLPRPDAPATTYDPTAPSLDADALRKRAGELARQGSGQRALLPFPMPPVAKPKSKVETAIDNARKPDCRTAYQSLGLAAIVPLIANEFGEGNCRW